MSVSSRGHRARPTNEVFSGHSSGARRLGATHEVGAAQGGAAHDMDEFEDVPETDEPDVPADKRDLYANLGGACCSDHGSSATAGNSRTSPFVHDEMTRQTALRKMYLTDFFRRFIGLKRIACPSHVRARIITRDADPNSPHHAPPRDDSHRFFVSLKKLDEKKSLATLPKLRSRERTALWRKFPIPISTPLLFYARLPRGRSAKSTRRTRF